MTFPTPSDSVLLHSASWIGNVMTGPLATGIAILAVAGLGLLMLSGRIDYKRGIGVILGCFIVFGASSIANGILRVSATGERPMPQAAVVVGQLPPPAPPKEAEPYDPYAGASIIR